MQHEVTISPYDLRHMLADLPDFRKVDVFLVDGTLLEGCSVRFQDQDKLILKGCPKMCETLVPLSSVKAIGFDSFYNYRGVSSRIFLMD